MIGLNVFFFVAMIVCFKLAVIAESRQAPFWGLSFVGWLLGIVIMSVAFYVVFIVTIKVTDRDDQQPQDFS
jgi:hypothetical protein